MGLDERFEALRRTRPPTADVDTAAALDAVAVRGGRPTRGRRGFVLAGVVAAAIVLVAGLVVVRAGDEGGSSVVAGEGPDANEEAPPPDDGPARLWLSATRVPVDGADVAAVILWDGDGESPTWGVAATLDRWTGDAWEDDRTFNFCADFWGCVGSLEPADDSPGLGITATGFGETGAMWVRVEGLETGWYRIRSEANDGTVAAGQFEVVDRAVDLPPADVPDGAVGEIRETEDRLVVGDPLRATQGPGPGLLADEGVTVTVNGSAELWSTAATRATYQRWEDGDWVDVADATFEDTDEVSRFVSLGAVLERAGDYRIVIDREDAPPLTGRIWVRDRAEIS